MLRHGEYYNEVLASEVLQKRLNLGDQIVLFGQDTDETRETVDYHQTQPFLFDGIENSLCKMTNGYLGRVKVPYEQRAGFLAIVNLYSETLRPVPIYLWTLFDEE
jgi:hypothetical protein